MRVRATKGRYVVEEGKVQVVDDTLFRADVSLPSDLVEGAYKVRMFITRGGKRGRPQGPEHRRAEGRAGADAVPASVNQPLRSTGLISLIIAAAAGWLASAAFRLMRR